MYVYTFTICKLIMMPLLFILSGKWGRKDLAGKVKGIETVLANYILSWTRKRESAFVECFYFICNISKNERMEGGVKEKNSN